MQMLLAPALILLTAFGAATAGNADSPIGKVIEMIGDLESKVIGEGEEAHRIYAEFTEFCEDKSKDLGFEIKTGKAEVEELTAAIEKEASTIETLTAKIEDLGATLAGGDGELKEATKIRETEYADFAAEEKELVTTIDMIQRALQILEKEMGGASMMQIKNAGSIADALEIMVKATAFSAADAGRLTALVQSSAEDEDAGAPQAAVYKGSSGKIIDTLQGLLDKAQTQLDSLRKTETTAQNNYELLKQSLETDSKNAKDDMEEAKKSLAESGEKKSVAQGDLTVTSKNLAEDIQALEDLHHDCMSKADDYESAVKEREEELAALAKAKQLIVEATSLSQTSGAASLFQMQSQRAALAARVKSGDSQAVKFLRRLAIKDNSSLLMQLANHMSSTMRFGAQAGEDPFAKVKGLIEDMIAKLEKDAEDDATQKAWCDKEMRETTEKKEDKDGEIEAMTTKIDQMSSSSAKLKEQVTVLQKELADLAASQKQMDKVRAEEKALYDKSQAETSKGLEGIKAALKVLTEYYAGKDSGAGEGIIGLLEVCESDFSKALADIEANEARAVTEYDAQTKQNEIEKTAKDQDVKYKTKEYTGLDKSVAETSADREGVQSELDAVMEYFEKIKDKCIAKPETYEEQKRRREAEIAGCKEALSILEGEAALLQSASVRRTLRGHRTLQQHRA